MESVTIELAGTAGALIHASVFLASGWGEPGNRRLRTVRHRLNSGHMESRVDTDGTG